MSLKKIFGVDKAKEQGGIWVDVCDNDDGSQCRIKVARMSMSNKKFAKETAKRNKKYRGRLDAIPIERQLRENIELFVDTTMLGWENVIDYRQTIKSGDPLPKLPYNRENAVWLLNDLPSLFDLLTTEAAEISNFQSENEIEAKNLEPSSNII